MKKTGKIGLYLLLGGISLTSLWLYSDEKQCSSNPMILSSIEGRQWVAQIVEQHPEILWLADSNVRKTEEGQALLQGTYSDSRDRVRNWGAKAKIGSMLELSPVYNIILISSQVCDLCQIN